MLVKFINMVDKKTYVKLKQAGELLNVWSKDLSDDITNDKSAEEVNKFYEDTCNLRCKLSHYKQRNECCWCGKYITNAERVEIEGKETKYSCANCCKKDVQNAA